MLRPLSMKKPVIAAVNGHCYAAALILAMSCDLRVVSENATFGSPGARLGMLPEGGQIGRLPMLMSRSAALELMHVPRVIVPPHPGLFSAMGLVSADRVYSDHRSAYMLLDDEAAPRLDALYGSMEDRLRARLGPGAEGAQFVRSFDGQLLGQSWETPMVEVPPGQITPAAIDTMIRSFHDAYERRNGNRFAALPVQTVTFRVQLVVPTKKVVYENEEFNLLQHALNIEEGIEGLRYNKIVFATDAGSSGSSVVVACEKFAPRFWSATNSACAFHAPFEVPCS